MKFTTKITPLQFSILLGLLLGVMIIFFIEVSRAQTTPTKDVPVVQVEITNVTSEVVSSTNEIKEYKTKVQEQDFNVYLIPEEYVEAGGYFPKAVQEYLYNLCSERDLDYYIAIALIERESSYKDDASGDSGNSIGYMQVQEKWHRERMEVEQVTDLHNSYQNIRVGLSYLDELYERYENWDKALMCYNMGESRAKELWSEGVYETEYTAVIQGRSQEIKQELQQD